MNKVKVQAPSNIAFIKYWGNKKDNIPLNESVSMTLDNCLTKTTACFSDKDFDEIYIKNNSGEKTLLEKNDIKGKKAYEQIEIIRKISGKKNKLTIESENNFPTGAGIASSASGFCALSGACAKIFEINDLIGNKKEFSKLVRKSGSASAARSVFGGFVSLKDGGDGNYFAEQIADEASWKLTDTVAILKNSVKKTPSSEGHRLAKTSPFLNTRLSEVKKRLSDVKQAIIKKDFEKLGHAIEKDTISMHAVMMTSTPPLFYLEPETLKLIKLIIDARNKGTEAYYSIDAGANVHVICEEKNEEKVNKFLSELKFVKSQIINHVGSGIKFL